MRPTLIGTARSIVISALLLAASESAVATEFKLDSREYKLALDPVKFGTGDPSKAADELWDKVSVIVSDTLGKTKKGKTRHEGSFDDTKERQTVFRDTRDCALNAVGYSVRERTKIKKDKLDPTSREMTLKFRTSDVVIAWEALPEGGKIKFEEDIAPLIVRRVDASGEKGAFARPPSMRSIFSVSLTQKVGPADEFKTVADVGTHFFDFKERLERAGSDIAFGTALAKGPVFHELVFQGASIDLGDVEAEVDLSLWYRDGKIKTEAPALAEVSFKYSLTHSDEIGEAARRALNLFKALQLGLDGWTSPDRETKTAAALPESCP